ncbi:DNA-methyltransferase [Streptomonospora litoralis]|uniref:Methyltransferase n=1 Tax=Streptomonospora litoralis TaxID=2498135 RepID=A0A4P6PZ78_9ACTN|nr:DNA methyltransferase [Streptomonospora litoralis]QBI53443.1 Modification methylase DpnIIB [Streptomonospora litoralis]
MPATIHHGDALAILPTLPTGTTDALITDPPYNAGGLTPAARRGDTARGKYVSGDAQHDLADFTGDTKDQRGYLAWLGLLLGHGLRITRPGGSALVFTDWSQLPTTTDALQAAGWTWRGIIPWHKPATRPTKDGFRRACEYVVWGTHGEPYRHAPTIYLPGLVEGSQPRGRRRQHITQKPVEVLRELVKITPAGGTILDPCAGAGSTGVAALAEGRAFVGVEISGHYAAIARDRLDQTAPE